MTVRQAALTSHEIGGQWCELRRELEQMRQSVGCRPVLTELAHFQRREAQVLQLSWRVEAHERLKRLLVVSEPRFEFRARDGYVWLIDPDDGATL